MLSTLSGFRTRFQFDAQSRMSGFAFGTHFTGIALRLRFLVCATLTTVPQRLYNRPMSYLSDPRRRSIVLLAGGLLLVFALLGGLQAFNTSHVRFLNPETAGETLAFAGLTVLVFILLLILLVMLLRNVLKVYASGSSSALGARLRSHMVLGAVLIALTPAVFMFLFSFQLIRTGPLIQFYKKTDRKLWIISCPRPTDS